MIVDEGNVKKLRIRQITKRELLDYGEFLLSQERSSVTVGKYMRDIASFISFASGRSVDKQLVLMYKEHLQKLNYAHRSINSMLASLNGLLKFLGLNDCTAKFLKVQRKTYCPEEKELKKSEYMRLLRAAENTPRLKAILQTICSTGIRISELRYFTVEAIKTGEVTVRCKGKTRTILIPGKLRQLLIGYAKKYRIISGCIFITRSGKPVDRSNIWSQMKKLCEKAGVDARKVFPHNLRKLFARTFYNMEKDIAKLADILGHGSIETTRIYIMTTGSEHRKKIDRLGLVI
ncbi:MAG: integrase [Clostridiales bacterium]|nr:integrase [Clostridiales bacterium]